MTIRATALVGLWLTCFAAPGVAAAQTPAAGSGAPAAGAPAPKAPDPDRQLVPSEPDFTLAALPGSLRMPAHRFTFRLTHRFTRAIGSGTAGDFFANFFEFDASARVGLELRYGLRSGTDIAVHRTSERAIQFLARQEIVGQGQDHPLTVDAVVGVDGLNNLSKAFGGTLGAIVSRRFGDHGAIYVEPLAVFNSTTDRFAPVGHDRTLMIGAGLRARVGASRTYLVIEAVPRLTGDRMGVDHVSVGIEKRAGGHVFQINVANSLGTTLRELAHGGARASDWFIGFNLSRKFY